MEKLRRRVCNNYPLKEYQRRAWQEIVEEDSPFYNASLQPSADSGMGESEGEREERMETTASVLHNQGTYLGEPVIAPPRLRRARTWKHTSVSKVEADVLCGKMELDEEDDWGKTLVTASHGERGFISKRLVTFCHMNDAQVGKYLEDVDGRVLVSMLVKTFFTPAGRFGTSFKSALHLSKMFLNSEKLCNTFHLESEHVTSMKMGEYASPRFLTPSFSFEDQFKGQVDSDSDED